MDHLGREATFVQSVAGRDDGFLAFRLAPALFGAGFA